MTATILLILSLVLGIESSTDPIVGVAALHVETGRRLEVRADERFPMASVFKLPLAVAVLRQVDAGKIRMNEKVTIQPEQFSPGHSPIRDDAKGKAVTLTIRELLRASTSVSDNTAGDYLLERVGGGVAVTRLMRSYGVDGIYVDRTEREIIAELRKPGGVSRYATDPRDTATPAGLAKLLLKLHRRELGLSKASQTFLMQVLIDTPTGLNRIKAGLPPGTILAHKTGTMPGTLNDAALITTPDGKQHVIIVVLTRAATKPNSEAERERIVADVARKVYAEMVK